MTRKEAIKLGDMALRCLAHNVNLCQEENYDSGYHIGKFLAYFFAASMYSTEEVALWQTGMRWTEECKNLSTMSGRVAIYPEIRQTYGNKYIWFVMGKKFFEEVLKETEKEQGKPLVEDIRKNCVVCE